MLRILATIGSFTILLVYSSYSFLYLVNDKPRILLNMLLSPDKKVRDETLKQLDEYDFYAKDIPYIHKAVMREYPDEEDGWSYIRYSLLQILYFVNDESTVGFIAEHYKDMPQNGTIRGSALRVLAEMNTPDSINTLAGMLEHFGDKESICPDDVLWPFHEKKNNAKLVMSVMLPLLKYKLYDNAVYDIANCYKDEHVVDSSVFSGYRQCAMDDYNAIERERVALTDEDGKRFMLDYSLEEVLKFFGAFRGDNEITAILKKSIETCKEPRLIMACALSLTYMAEEVPVSAMKKIAARPEMRMEFYQALDKLGRKALFPKDYYSQFFFAEADMVNFLELDYDYPPEKIELVQTRVIKIDGEPGRLYLFRFYYSEEDCWMAGISGPQPVNPKEILIGGSMTSTGYNVMDDMSIEEHFRFFLDKKEQEE